MTEAIETEVVERKKPSWAHVQWNLVGPLLIAILAQFAYIVSMDTTVVAHGQEQDRRYDSLDGRTSAIEKLIQEQNIPNRITGAEAAILRLQGGKDEMEKSINDINVTLGKVDAKIEFLISNMYGDAAHKGRDR